MEFPRSSLDGFSGCAKDTRKLFTISVGGQLYTNPIFGLGKLHGYRKEIRGPSYGTSDGELRKLELYVENDTIISWSWILSILMVDVK